MVIKKYLYQSEAAGKTGLSLIFQVGGESRKVAGGQNFVDCCIFHFLVVLFQCSWGSNS